MSPDPAPFIPPSSEEHPIPPEPWRLFGSRSFFKLWLAQVFSSLGDWVGFFAILQLTDSVSNGSAAAFSLVIAVRMVPGFFLATLGGVKATINIAKVMMKRLHHTGSTLRPRSNADKAAMVAAIEAKVMPLLRDGRVKPLMDSSFPLEKAADAHRRMETSAHIGKIVLAV